MVQELGIEDVHLDMVRPLDAGDRSPEYLRSILPRYTVIAQEVESMLQRFPRGQMPMWVIFLTVSCPTEPMRFSTMEYKPRPSQPMVETPLMMAGTNTKPRGETRASSLV